MYLDKIPDNILPGQRVRIKYDCDGGFKLCGTEGNPIYKVAKKNADAHDGKHICRSCQMAANNPVNRKEVLEKIKKTNLERYGTELPLNSEKNIAARVEKMFGTEEAKEKIVAKRKVTSQERYGADHIMKTEEGVGRLKTAMQEKYGVDFPLQSEEVRERMRQTCQERYGVDNPLSSPEVRLKVAQTMLEKYGVEHYNQLPDMKEYFRQNCTAWLAESYDNPWAKGITRPQEWNDKQRETVVTLMELGQWKAGYPRSKKGWCRPEKCKKPAVYFRSSYEAIYCYHLSKRDDVEWFTFEGFRIEYTYQGKNRYYVPDFLIKWKGKNDLSIRELKAEFLRDDEQVRLKTECAKLFAETNSMNFQMLCCNDIAELGITFEFLKEIGFVETEA